MWNIGIAHCEDSPQTPHRVIAVCAGMPALGSTHLTLFCCIGNRTMVCFWDRRDTHEVLQLYGTDRQR